MGGNDGVLLVLGSGRQQYREYLLRATARRHKLWLFDAQEADWQAPYVAGSTVVDVFEPQATADAARRLAARHPVAGVYCYHEGAIATAARVAAELGVRAPSPDAVAAVRDKSLTRDRLTLAGFRQPRHAVVATAQDALDAAAAIGFPLVAKPLALASSQGVVKVNSAAELDWALGVSRGATETGMTNRQEVLLEEFLTGPEISIDAASYDGEYLPFIIARKQLGAEPYFDEMGHTVDAADPLFADDELLQMLAKAHDVLGWSDGVTHTEVKFTPDGPAIIEVNGRLGGDLIPYLGILASGVDPAGIAADVSLGVRPDTRRTRISCAAIRFLCPPASCVAQGVRLPSPGDGVFEAVALAEPGTRLLVPPDGYAAEGRYAYLIARASKATECEDILDRAAAAVALESDPLPAGCP